MTLLDGQIMDTYRLPNDRFGVLDSNGHYEMFNQDKKMNIYRSQCVSDNGLYPTDRNIQGAQWFFGNHMKFHDKIISGNSAFYYNKPGLYFDVVYWDVKRYYPTLFNQIANHIDQDYFGYALELSKEARQAELDRMRKNGTKFSQRASKRPIIPITDLAKNAIKIDCSDNSEMIRKIKALSDGPFVDEADMRVSKITRNALCFGLGFRQKNARINNVCALVMFFARKVLSYAIEELRQKHNVLYSHTDSFMCEHLHTKELDEAIRTASGLVDNEYFGNTEIISLGLNNVGIKAKYEELMIFNQMAYIGSTIAPKGKRDFQLKIASMAQDSQSWCIDREGHNIQEELNNSIGELFSPTKLISNYETEFLYSNLKLRLSDSYRDKLIDMWDKENPKVYDKACVLSQTLKNINQLKRNLTAADLANRRYCKNVNRDMTARDFGYCRIIG